MKEKKGSNKSGNKKNTRNNTKNNTRNHTKKSKKNVIIVVVVIVLLVVIGVLAAVIYNLLHKKPEAPTRSNTGLVTDGDINEKAANATFTTDMNMIWTFPSGSPTSTNAHIGNSEMNQYDVFFEIFLDDETEEVLYTSPVIPVGKQLDQLTLDKALPDGTYEAICRYHLMDDEDPDVELSTVSFNVTLMFAQQ